MFVAYSHFFILLLSLLVEECGPQEMTPRYLNWYEDTMYNMDKNVFVDLKQKYDSVQYVKSRYKRFTSYQMGTIAYIIRMKYSQLMHMTYRCRLEKKTRTVIELTRNATSCQRLFYDVHTLTEAIRLHYKNITLEESEEIPYGNVPGSDMIGNITDSLDNNTVKGNDKNQTHPDNKTIPGGGRRRFGGLTTLNDNSRRMRQSLRFLDMAEQTIRLQKYLKQGTSYSNKYGFSGTRFKEDNKNKRLNDF